MTSSEKINYFYQAFADGRMDDMLSCYHPDVVFSDPAFGELKGKQVPAMWRMLHERAKGNIKITFSDIQEDGNAASATWIADYLYSANKRPVHNVISAKFKFSEGLIIDHKDHFDLWKWSKQALGLTGFLFGWSGFFKNKIQSKTNYLLIKYMQDKGK